MDVYKDAYAMNESFKKKSFIVHFINDKLLRRRQILPHTECFQSSQ